MAGNNPAFILSPEVTRGSSSAFAAQAVLQSREAVGPGAPSASIAPRWLGPVAGLLVGALVFTAGVLIARRGR